MALLMAGPETQAQGFKRNDAPSVSPRISGNRGLSTELKLAGVQSTADYIVAVVNQEPITHMEVEKRVSRIQESAPAGSRLPAGEALRQQVLDALINEKVQLSFARTSGMEVPEAELDAAIENIATQNKITVADLKDRMRSDGLDYQRYRDSLREQILLERVRQREVNARIQVSDADVAEFYAKGAEGLGETSYNIAHLLIVVPEGSSPAQVQALQAKALELQQRASKGENFAQLVKANSADTNTRDQGGTVGMRPASRLPDLFVDAVKNLAVGKVAPLVRSGAGFHVVKLVERENSGKATYTQQRARHILIRTTPQLDARMAARRMDDIRKQIVGGQASFAQLARQYSEDGSAMRGGDLGWTAPGQFVPEFEKALLALQPGQVSEPVVTRFGVHLIQLIERKEVELSEQQKKEAARSVLREQQFEATYEEWAKELRAAAYVELRDAP
ncbi:MAG: peptidylprolyl isomerase [Aquabacterium sp.]|uniref:peptidylprolyl isomerase n=1 Tax=Aquabacterium sp. TaxID=1872578 RepID=UPI00271C7008|nr:peptidylprolyl isomerase [Aquabacterium sp.]MDO9002172.1 peptidylprolyl isomerase [Aquabacterium sp.]